MPDSKYLDIKEAAQYTRTSIKTLRNWTSARKIPFLKVGGRVLFSAAELDAWLASKAVPDEGRRA